MAKLPHYRFGKNLAKMLKKSERNFPGNERICMGNKRKDPSSQKDPFSNTSHAHILIADGGEDPSVIGSSSVVCAQDFL